MPATNCLLMVPVLPPLVLCLQVRSRALTYEQAEAAARSEAYSALEQVQQELEAANAARQQLQRQQQEADQKLAATGEALTAATSEVEQLTLALEAAAQRQQQQEVRDRHVRNSYKVVSPAGMVRVRGYADC